MARPGDLAYLMRQLNSGGTGGFTKEWSLLSDADKATLKQWAKDEMDYIEAHGGTIA